MKIVDNYKLPPFSTSDTKAMLRYFGTIASFDDDDNLSVHVFDKYRLPKITCKKIDNPNGLITISYPGPPTFGLQSFSFSVDDFLFTPLTNIVSGAFPKFIAAAFSITPTIVKRVYNHKRGQFKLALQPSPQKIRRLFK